MRPHAWQFLLQRRVVESNTCSFLGKYVFFLCSISCSVERPRSKAITSSLPAPGSSVSSAAKDLQSSAARTSRGFSSRPVGSATCTRCEGNAKANVKKKPAPTAVPPRSSQRHRTTIAHELELAPDISHIISATYKHVFMDNASSPAIVTARPTLLLD